MSKTIREIPCSWCRSVFGIALLLMLPSSSHAQSNPAIEELVVTAQMRDESLQIVPLSIGVYDKHFIEQVGGGSLTDMEAAIPSLNFGTGDRNTRGEIVIRGIGDYARNIGTNARVAVYVDGVLTGRSSSFDQGLLDVAQIEVLRGPQGTLAGTNALAGAINIITEKPKGKTSAELQVGTGNYGATSVTGKLNVPLLDDLFASVLLSTSDQDGYIKNVTLDRELQGFNRDIAKFKLRYVGVERLTLDFGIDYLQDDEKSTNAEALANSAFGGYASAPAVYQVAHDADEFQYRELKGGVIEASYETLADYRWTSITGIRRNEFRELNDEDFSPRNIAVSHFDEQSDQISQELRVASPKGETADFVAGIYILNQEISTSRYALTGPAFSVPNAMTQTPAAADVQATSFYTHGNYYLGRGWSVTAGVRYVDERKSIDYSSIDSTRMFVNIEHLSDRQSFQEWLPKFGINFQTTPDLLLYTSAARGYKSGGWNADFISTLEHFQFEPEYAVNYEAGAKASFFDQQITLNTSIFLTRFDEFQVFQFLPTQAATGTTISLTNAGKVTSQGLEVDAAARVTEHIDLKVGAALTDAAFDEFKNGGGIGVDYDGHSLPFAPENSYFIGVDYTRPFVHGAEIFIHLNYSYTGDYFSNPDNASGSYIPSRNLVNARIGATVGSAWELSFWAKNVANESSLRQQSLSFLRVHRGVYTPPRTYGLDIKYRFD